LSRASKGNGLWPSKSRSLLKKSLNSKNHCDPPSGRERRENVRKKAGKTQSKVATQNPQVLEDNRRWEGGWDGRVNWLDWKRSGFGVLSPVWGE